MKLGDLWTAEILPGIVRLGTTYVGCYLIEERGAYTFVDTGLPGYRDQLFGYLADRDIPLSSVKAVVLTHHHADHRGNAERLRTETGARVLIHETELELVGEKVKAPSFPVWKPRVLRYVLHCIRRGVIGVTPVVEATSFADGEVLDVPGRPRIVHAPGHTAGHVAVDLGDRGGLIVADALATIDLVSGVFGPRLLPPFSNDDHEQAYTSLERIEAITARCILPGHGRPWEGSPREAVALARTVEARRAMRRPPVGSRRHGTSHP